MDIGIGLPNAVRGVDRDGTVEFARRADVAGFSSLGTIDRLAFPNYESLVSLAAAAAVTKRIRLMTDILIAPQRNTAWLAKQAATLDGISDGRLVLGLAVGGRPDDYEVAGVDFHVRGRIFDRQLAELLEFWKGKGGVGPAPVRGERPALLIGGTADPTFPRAARYADGWTLGGGTPQAFSEGKAKLEAAWEAAGREDRPRTVALFYYSLGERADEAAREDLLDYYAWLGDYAQQIYESAAKDADTVNGYLAAFEEVGADEVICFPVSKDPGQVDLLAEAVPAGAVSASPT
jgi:alkanesulfonate monooxygenase SsuD/methylene tetrahydromethanopterin reductase-like flavin-dependent oxidoreductase (luciferase family)